MGPLRNVVGRAADPSRHLAQEEYKASFVGRERNAITADGGRQLFGNAALLRFAAASAACCQLPAAHQHAEELQLRAAAAHAAASQAVQRGLRQVLWPAILALACKPRGQQHIRWHMLACVLCCRFIPYSAALAKQRGQQVRLTRQASCGGAHPRSAATQAASRGATPVARRGASRRAASGPPQRRLLRAGAADCTQGRDMGGARLLLVPPSHPGKALPCLADAGVQAAGRHGPSQRARRGPPPAGPFHGPMVRHPCAWPLRSPPAHLSRRCPVCIRRPHSCLCAYSSLARDPARLSCRGGEQQADRDSRAGPKQRAAVQAGACPRQRARLAGGSAVAGQAAGQQQRGITSPAAAAPRLPLHISHLHVNAVWPSLYLVRALPLPHALPRPRQQLAVGPNHCALVPAQAAAWRQGPPSWARWHPAGHSRRRGPSLTARRGAEHQRGRLRTACLRPTAGSAAPRCWLCAPPRRVHAAPRPPHRGALRALPPFFSVLQRYIVVMPTCRCGSKLG